MQRVAELVLKLAAELSVSVAGFQGNGNLLSRNKAYDLLLETCEEAPDE